MTCALPRARHSRRRVSFLAHHRDMLRGIARRAARAATARAAPPPRRSPPRRAFARRRRRRRTRPGGWRAPRRTRAPSPTTRTTTSPRARPPTTTATTSARARACRTGAPGAWTTRAAPGPGRRTPSEPSSSASARRVGPRRTRGTGRTTSCAGRVPRPGAAGMFAARALGVDGAARDRAAAAGAAVGLGGGLTDGVAAGARLPPRRRACYRTPAHQRRDVQGAVRHGSEAQAVRPEVRVG